MIKIKYLFLLMIIFQPLVGHGRDLIVGVNAKYNTISKALKNARPGDILKVSKGLYKENPIVKIKNIKIVGEKGTIIDGGGKGHILQVLASNVTISNLELINSGKGFANSDAGIFTSDKALNPILKNNTIKNTLWGIWVEASHGIKIIHNKVYGQKNIMSQKRGNGIHLWNVKNAAVNNNFVDGSRDAIYIFATSDTEIKNNEMVDLRYGIHYMHADDNVIEGNTVKNSTVALALMFSRRLVIKGNISINNRDNGILMRDLMHSELYENIIDGSEKGLFFYNSLNNKVSKNIIINNSIGAHVWAGSFDNIVFDNAFINNEYQTRYVGARDEKWSGNYWSNYLGWDLDKNKIGDVPFIGNGIVERLVWTYPVLRVLLNSPAVQTLRMSESQFPILRSPSIIDEGPKMKMPEGIKYESIN